MFSFEKFCYSWLLSANIKIHLITLYEFHLLNSRIKISNDYDDLYPNANLLKTSRKWRKIFEEKTFDKKSFVVFILRFKHASAHFVIHAVKHSSSLERLSIWRVLLTFNKWLKDLKAETELFPRNFSFCQMCDFRQVKWTFTVKVYKCPIYWAKMKKRNLLVSKGSFSSERRQKLFIANLINLYGNLSENLLLGKKL